MNAIVEGLRLRCATTYYQQSQEPQQVIHPSKRYYLQRYYLQRTRPMSYDSLAFRRVVKFQLEGRLVAR